MKKAYIFPGQGSQYPQMGKPLYETLASSRTLFDQADEILGFSLTKIMFEGSKDDLTKTEVTQPAIFTHSIAALKTLPKIDARAVAGHSLGEFSALVAVNCLSFEDGLKLVQKRALAMQEACEITEGTMAAVLGMDDKSVEEICEKTEGIVVAANYNCPGQLVISGEVKAIETAVENLKKAGAKRAIILNVGGAFHSPLMEPARLAFANAINSVNFKDPDFPIYQNVNALPQTNANDIKENLKQQLTQPVRWTSTIQNMIADGFTDFTEIGPGNTLQGLVRKIDRSAKFLSIG